LYINIQLKNDDSYPFAPEYEGLNVLEALRAGRFEVAVAAHSDGSRYPIPIGPVTPIGAW
jgi:hypothetical protein